VNIGPRASQRILLTSVANQSHDALFDNVRLVHCDGATRSRHLHLIENFKPFETLVVRVNAIKRPALMYLHVNLLPGSLAIVCIEWNLLDSNAFYGISACTQFAWNDFAWLLSDPWSEISIRLWSCVWFLTVLDGSHYVWLIRSCCDVSGTTRPSVCVCVCVCMVSWPLQSGTCCHCAEINNIAFAEFLLTWRL
jgi:hypothetical protein